MQDLLAGDCTDLRLNSALEHSRHDLSVLGEWDILFRKVVPCDEANKHEKFSGSSKKAFFPLSLFRDLFPSFFARKKQHIVSKDDQEQASI